MTFLGFQYDGPKLFKRIYFIENTTPSLQKHTAQLVKYSPLTFSFSGNFNVQNC